VPLGIARVLPADPDHTMVREAIQAARPQRGRERLDRGNVKHDPTADLIERLKRDAATDVLTGLYNRRAGQQNSDRELARAKRNKQPASMVLFDVDKFKEINDTSGHPAGDRVLREVSGVFRNTVRAYDVLARWGGEEFLVFLSADLEQARLLAERARRAVEVLRIEVVGPVTVSGGVSSSDGDYDFERMFADADRRLLRAKQEGRNRIISSDE